MSKSKFVLCIESEKPSGHRVGGPQCTAPPSRGKTGILKRTPERTTQELRTEQENSSEVRENSDGEHVSEVSQVQKNLNATMMEDSLVQEMIIDHYGPENSTSES